jgi:hypothetical protein
VASASWMAILHDKVHIARAVNPACQGELSPLVHSNLA